MLGSEPDLQMHIKSFRVSPQNSGELKAAYFVTVLNFSSRHNYAR